MLLFLDGQAHYSAAQLDRKWVVNATSVTWTIPTEGRWGGNPCIKRVALDNVDAGYLSCAPRMTQSAAWVPQGGGVCGFAFKTEALARHAGGAPDNDGGNCLLAIFDGGARFHIGLVLNPSGTLSLYESNNGSPSGPATLLTTGIGAVTDAAWVFLEVKWLIHGSGGYCRVRSNGLEVLNYTGSTVGDSPGTSWSAVRLLHSWSNPTPLLLTCWLNDVYLCDLLGSGDQVRDFLGDTRVALIVPNGVGAVTAWAPNTGANWAAVDEAPADDDTTYVSTSTVTAADSYAYTDLPTGAVPLGFQVCLLGKKETEGAASIKATMRSGGTDHAAATAQSIASSTQYTYTLQPYDTNPITGARATATEINGAEFGVLRA